MGQRLEAIGYVFSPGTICDARYLIRTELAGGATSSILLADDLETMRPVAIKVVAPDTELELTEREATLMARVSHDNVARIYDAGHRRGYDYLVIEHLGGEDLCTTINRSLADGALLSIETALGLLRQICDGLDAVHAADVIHRDLKPSNVMVDRQGRACLIDFGTAQRRAETLELVGTPLYIAPEIVESRDVPAHQRHLSDIFSLGVLTFELFSAHEPYALDDKLSTYEQLQQQVAQTPQRLGRLRPDLPTAISDVVASALSLDLDARPQSGGEFYRRLRAAALGSQRRSAPYLVEPPAPAPVQRWRVATPHTMRGFIAPSPAANDDGGRITRVTVPSLRAVG